MTQLPRLPYAYDALAPVVSETTMRTHHDKHHAKYVQVANALALEAGLADLPLEDVIRRAAMAPDRKLFNNAAQAWNHAFFWNCMAPHPHGPAGPLADAIGRSFGGLDTLRQAFLDEGAAHFGSGWVWVAAQDTRLTVFSTHDGDTVVTRDLTPLLVCDLWEHAYYLDHRNDRAGYLALWWERLANWDFAQAQFAAGRGQGGAWRYPTDAETYVPPIREHGAFEHALEEAGILLEDPPAPGSGHDRRFGALLGRIAEYEPSAPPVGKSARVPADLDARIRAAARACASRIPDEDHHWSPMIGGDLHGHDETRPPADNRAAAAARAGTSPLRR